MMNAVKLGFSAELRRTAIRPDGTHREIDRETIFIERAVRHAQGFWSKLFAELRKEIPFIAGMSLAAFINWALQGKGSDGTAVLALVTTAGINYEMASMVSNANPMSNLKYHDSGTGTNSPVIGDTALQSPAGPARVVGTATNPSGTQLQQSAVIVYSASLAITEWGLFNAATLGTMWDRRTRAAYNVNNLESIQFDYILTGNAGGS